MGNKNNKNLVRKYIIIYMLRIIFLALLLTTGMAFSGINPEKTTGKTVVYGGDYDYPPFEYLDKNGNPAGFNIEIIKAIAEEAGWDVYFRTEPWGTILQDFKKGKIDIISMFYSREREAFADFSHSFTIHYHLVFMRQAKYSPVSSIKHLGNMKMIVEENSYVHDALLKRYKPENIISAETENDAMLMLSSGKGDCALVSRIGGHEALYKFRLKDIVTASPPQLPVEYCFAVKKGNAALLRELNAGMDSIRRSGKYEAIDHYWLEERYNRQPTIPEAARRIAWMLASFIFLSGIILLWLTSLRRIVRKQTKQLRKDIDKISRTEKQIAHLNRTLKAIRNINRLIVKEKDPCLLIKNACKFLAYPEGYKTAMIVLVDKNGTPCQYYQSGFGDRFRVMEQNLNHGKFPPCYAKRLLENGAYVISNVSEECKECCLYDCYTAKKIMCSKIEYGKNLWGFMVISFSSEDINESEEKLLLDEVAGDMAYALHGIHAEKARRQTEQKLEKSEEQYRSLFEETKDFICICSPKGKFADINPAGVKAFGYSSKEEMLKLDMEEDIYWNPAEGKKLRKMLDEAGFVKDTEFEMKKKNGDKLLIRLTATASRDKNGKIANYLVIGRDITEHKRIGQQLIQTEKMAAMGELMSGVAHEINNPLTAMIGFAELILKTNEKVDPELKKDISKIHDAAMRVYKITTGLLRFARKEKPLKKKVWVNKLLEESMALKEYHLHVKNIQVKKILQKELPPVNADAKQLEQVFLNIMNNAEHAMAEKSDSGCLTISTSLAKGGIKIEFLDTGPGIPEKNMKKIFDPFFTTKPADKGTGLGLSVSYGIIKEHGGDIYAGNRKEGGAVFTIFLPAGEDDGKRENPDS